jgi:hypothetical protein
MELNDVLFFAKPLVCAAVAAGSVTDRSIKTNLRLQRPQ